MALHPAFSSSSDDPLNGDEVGEYLQKIYPELQGAVLVIHPKNNGEISEAASGKNKEELDLPRKEAKDKTAWKALGYREQSGGETFHKEPNLLEQIA